MQNERIKDREVQSKWRGEMSVWWLAQQVTHQTPILYNKSPSEADPKRNI